MLTQHTVESAADAAGFTGSVRYVPITGSTNTDLLRMAEEGAPPWSLVVAGHQEAGRGRLGRAWLEKPGSSLLMSILMRPSIEPTAASLVTLAAGVAMTQAVGLAGEVTVRCKWPNDLMAGGRKLGGILAEAEVEDRRLRHVVIGVGLNVSQTADDFPPELREVATSLAMEGGRSEPEILLRACLIEFRLMADPDVAGFQERTLGGYARVCETLGRRVAATTTTGARVEGTATGVGDRGELLLDVDGRVVEVAFGEVEHLR